MSKFAKRTAVFGAGIALAAVLSPVAYAAGQGAVDFEPAPRYVEASTKSKKFSTIPTNQGAKVNCLFNKADGSHWYEVDNGGNPENPRLWSETKHFNSLVHIKKCAGSQ